MPGAMLRQRLVAQAARHKPLQRVVIHAAPVLGATAIDFRPARRGVPAARCVAQARRPAGQCP
jgi:hypothetical protein